MDGSTLLIIVAVLTALVYFLQALDLLEKRARCIWRWIKERRHEEVNRQTEKALPSSSNERSSENEQEMPPQEM